MPYSERQHRAASDGFDEHEQPCRPEREQALRRGVQDLEWSEEAGSRASTLDGHAGERIAEIISASFPGAVGPGSRSVLFICLAGRERTSVCPPLPRRMQIQPNERCLNGQPRLPGQRQKAGLALDHTVSVRRKKVAEACMRIHGSMCVVIKVLSISVVSVRLQNVQRSVLSHYPAKLRKTEENSGNHYPD